MGKGLAGVFYHLCSFVITPILSSRGRIVQGACSHSCACPTFPPFSCQGSGAWHEVGVMTEGRHGRRKARKLLTNASELADLTGFLNSCVQSRPKTSMDWRVCN